MKNYSARLVLVGVCLLASASSAFACLNTIGRGTVSEPIHVNGLGAPDFLNALTTHEGKAYWLGVLAELKAEQVKTSDGRIENLTNTAVALLHLGRIKQAIGILENLERTKSGLYYTAANLGTAYELNGEHAKALKWIKEGINRNPAAHNGSEWLHVRILETKLALEQNPNWLATNSVIGLHRLTDEQLRAGDVATDNLGNGIELKKIEAALIYQLHERLEFIKPSEGVVANLLFDLSRTFARTRGPEHAAIVREFAQTYGPDLTPWAAADPPLTIVDVPPPASMTAYRMAGTSAVIVALLVAIVVVLKRRREVR